MPSKWRLKRVFGPLVQVMARGFGRAGLSPNGATWIVLGSAILSVIVLVTTRLVWLFGLLIFFTGLMDGVDGAIAKKFSMTSKLGEFFDSFTDRLSEIILSLGFLLYYTGQKVVIGISIESWVGYLIMGSIMVSYVRARAVLIVKGDYDKGLFARSERLFVLFIFAILTLIDLIFLAWGIIVVAIGSNITAFYRVYEYRKMLKAVPPVPVPPVEMATQDPEPEKGN